MVESRKILEGEAILVATDGSPDAGAALAAATELCQKTGGSLHLAHTLPDVNAPLVGDPARFEEEGTSLLEEAEAQVSGTGLRLGIVMIAVGIGPLGGVTGVVIAVVGIVPILAGAFNFCLVEPLVGGYFSGERNLQAAPSRRNGGPGRRGRPQH